MHILRNAYNSTCYTVNLAKHKSISLLEILNALNALTCKTLE